MAKAKPKTQPAPYAGTYLQIPVTQIVIPKNAPRAPKAADGGLLRSVLQFGILQPLVVRPIAGGKMELRAGARRLAAARAAGLETVPAFVFELDDDIARQVTVTENLQRKDLPPLVEAAAIADLLSKDWTHQRIAEQLGRSAQWVARRASLLRLTPAARTFAGSEDGCWLTAEHLEVIARLSPEGQDALVEDLFDDPISVQSLKNWSSDQQVRLAEARFPVADPGLVPEAGSCVACPHRSGKAPLLFDDQDGSPDAIGKNEICLRRSCFQAKAESHAQQRLAEAREQHGDALVSLSDGYGGYGKKGVLNSWEWTKAKKSDRGARAGVITDGPDTGKVVLFKPTSQASGTAVAAATGGGGGNAKPRTKPLRTRREELERRRRRDVINGGIVPLLELAATRKGANGAEIRERLRPHLATLVSRFGVAASRVPSRAWSTDADAEAAIDDVLRRCAEEMVVRLRCQGAWRASKEHYAEACQVAEAIGFNHQSAYDHVCEQLPEPKSWANLKADGTPKAKKG